MSLKEKLGWQILLHIFYRIIVFTVFFVILNIVIIFKLWVGLLRGSYRDYMGTFSF